MENRISTLALITVFYTIGLSAFYADCHTLFTCSVAAVLFFLCIRSKLKPGLCIILNLIFIFGFYNAKFHNKEFDTLSAINSANNVIARGRVYSIPSIAKEKKTAKFFLGAYKVKMFDEDFAPNDTKILVSIQNNDEKYNDIKIGDVVEIKGNLRSPKSASNPSEFDYKKYLKNKDTFVILYSNNKEFKILNHPDIKNAKNKPKELWWSILQGLDITRDKIISKHGKYIKSPNLEVLGGIVFGDDAVNPPDAVKQSLDRKSVV